jgi:hypothetical protein
VPSPQPRDAKRIIRKKKIENGMFFPAARALLVRIGPRADARIVRRLASAPLRLGEDDGCAAHTHF